MTDTLAFNSCNGSLTVTDVSAVYAMIAYSADGANASGAGRNYIWLQPTQ